MNLASLSLRAQTANPCSNDSEARFIACSLKTSTVPCDVTILPRKLTVVPETSLCVKQLQMLLDRQLWYNS